MNAVHVVDSYVHNGRVAVLVELSAESDYATQTDEFKALVRDVAMHIAASSPVSVASLLEQPFVREPAIKVGQLVANTSSALREHISVARFVRWDTTSVIPIQPEPPKNPAAAVRQLRA
jgi:translation elongation factor EF-Ts